MLKKNVMTCALALVFAAATAGAQSTSPGADQQTPSGSSTTGTTSTTSQAGSERTTTQAGTTTLTGCVYEEKDVPGRTPNVAEQAGMLEDYILAVDTSAASGATGTTGTTATAGTSGSMAKGKMFKLEHADDEKLKSLVGKRVEVTGRIDAEAGDRPMGTAGAGRDESAGPDRVELPEFEITSIREVSGTCPAKPAQQ